MPAKNEAQRRYFGRLYGCIKKDDLSSLSERDRKVIEDMGVEKIRHFVKKEASTGNYATFVSAGYILSKIADMGATEEEEEETPPVMDSSQHSGGDENLSMGTLPPLPDNAHKLLPKDVRLILQQISASNTDSPEAEEQNSQQNT